MMSRAWPTRRTRSAEIRRDSPRFAEIRRDSARLRAGLVDQALVEQVALQQQVSRRPSDATGGGRRTLLAGDAARLLQRARDARLKGGAERRERRADACSQLQV